MSIVFPSGSFSIINAGPEVVLEVSMMSGMFLDLSCFWIKRTSSHFFKFLVFASHPGLNVSRLPSKNPLKLRVKVVLFFNIR